MTLVEELRQLRDLYNKKGGLHTVAEVAEFIFSERLMTTLNNSITQPPADAKEVPTQRERKEWAALADAMARLVPNIDSVKIIRRLLAALERVEGERDAARKYHQDWINERVKEFFVARDERDALRTQLASLRTKLNKPADDDPPVSFAALMDSVSGNCTSHQASLIEDLICYHIRRASPHPIESPELIREVDAAGKVKEIVSSIAEGSNWSEKAILKELQPLILATSSNEKRLREAHEKLIQLKKDRFNSFGIEKWDELEELLSPTLPRDEIEKGLE